MSWASALNTMLPGGSITFDSRGRLNDFQSHWNRPGRASHSKTNGVDVSKRPKGSEIFSPIEGKVIYTTTNFGIVAVKDKNGNIHRFLHLSAFAVKPNDHVKVGTKIGREGGVGRNGVIKYTEHLHYDIDLGGKGYYVDPVKWWNEGVDPGEIDPNPERTTLEEDAKTATINSGGDNEEEVDSRITSPRANSTVNTIDNSPNHPANVGTPSEYAPRKAARSSASNAQYALWTNRVPLHEPWPRTMLEDETTNGPSAGPFSNVRHKPQYTDDKTAETSGKIGRVDEITEYERNKFWRR